MRQPGDQIDVNFGEAGLPQATNLFENGRAFVPSSHGLRFPIDEGLHAEAHPVHSTLQQGFDERGSKRARSAFDGDLRIGRNGKLSAQDGEDAEQLRAIEDGGSSAAEVDGVGGVITRRSARRSERTSQLRRKLPRVGDIFEQAGNVIFVSGLREDVGGEVAIAALGRAEGNGDVEAEGHAVALFYGTNEHPRRSSAWTCLEIGEHSSKSHARLST